MGARGRRAEADVSALQYDPDDSVDRWLERKEDFAFPLAIHRTWKFQWRAVQPWSDAGYAAIQDRFNIRFPAYLRYGMLEAYIQGYQETSFLVEAMTQAPSHHPLDRPYLPWIHACDISDEDKQAIIRRAGTRTKQLRTLDAVVAVAITIGLSDLERKRFVAWCWDERAT
jgi:hypothetical protein